MRMLIVAIVLFAGLLPGASGAQESRRLALIIGNDAYAEVTPLERAVADARAYRKMLEEERGFDVTYVENADRETTIAAIGAFLNKVRPNDTTMVVYSGHGVQLDPDRRDTLYFLPTDVPGEGPGRSGASFFMDSYAVNFARLSAEVSARQAGLRLFVIDACRNNPFPPSTAGRAIGLSRGLGNIRASRGEFVFFAAAPGGLSLDRLPGDDPDPNSVFTRVFLEEFRSGAYLEDVANDVQERVLELSRRSQISQEPYYTDGVAGKTCIDSECGMASTPSGGGSELEATYWRLCETRDTLSYCRAYLKSFPGGPHAPLAEMRIDEMEGFIVAGTTASGQRVVTIGPASSTAAESGPEPAAIPAVIPEPLPAATPTATPEPVPEPAVMPTPEPEPEPEPEPRVAAVDPTTMVPTYEAQRVEEDARLARQREAYLAWTRLEGSWDIRAVRDFKARYPDAEQFGEADRRIAFLRDRHREAQAELNRLGYKAGAVDGDWGRRSAKALRAFQRDQGLARDGVVSQDGLYALKTAKPRVAAAPPTPAPAAQPASTPTAPKPAPEPVVKRAAAIAPEPASEPEPETEVAALTPPTGAITDGATWRATATTSRGTTLVATMTRTGKKLKLKVKFDHRGNLDYYSWMIDRYTKSCSDSATKGKFECWFSGDVSQSSPTSPGAKIKGKFPRLRVEAHNMIGTAELVFAPK